VNASSTTSPRMERDFKSTGRTARCRPPKPSAVVVEYVSPITGSKIVVIRGSLEGVKKRGKTGFRHIL